MSIYQKHLFVCINQRDEDDTRGSCSQKGSKDFYAKLKAEIKNRKLHTKIRINRAGCLGTCNQGISMVIYPAGIWYGKLSESDIPEIVEQTLLNDEIIERLLMPFMKKKIMKEIK